VARRTMTVNIMVPSVYTGLECVWQCSCGCFSNNFSCQNACQWFFLFFKNHFWHQYIKIIQNIQTKLNFNKKKFKIFWERNHSRVPKRSLTIFITSRHSLFDTLWPIYGRGYGSSWLSLSLLFSLFKCSDFDRDARLHIINWMQINFGF
jgi:hypothetical protein